MGFSANVLKFDKNNNVEDFTFILSTKNYKHIGKLNSIKRDTINCVGNLNSANEISFEIYKTIDGKAEEHWDNIVDLKSVYVKELNEYFEIKVTYNDALDEVKKIVGTSLCEAELSQINIYGTEINTEADINRDNYIETKFYDKDNPKASLLHRVLSFAPHYKIKYVDPSLHNIQRSFSIDGTTIYDFLTSECAEQFNCLFAFDSTDRSISVYDLYSTCLECGYRGAYNDFCPECGSTHITYFGEDTLIFVNKENLTDDVQFETDIDSMKNCFKLVAGDDIMTTAIINQNPNGTAYMYTVPIEQRADMSEEFLQKFDKYNELYDSYTDEYQQLNEDIYEITDQIIYYQSTMMPEPKEEDEEKTETTISISEKEAQKLTANNLSPIGLATLSSSTSVETVNNAIKNYSRVFVNTSLVKVEVEESIFTYKGKDADDWNYGEWKGKLKVTCYSNKEDIVVTEQMTIKVHDNYGDYCKQAALKEVTQVTKEDSVFDVLGIEDLNEFKSALELYCLKRLRSFEDAIKAAISALTGLQQSTEDAEWYEDLYIPYFNKLEACSLEIEKREKTIKELESQLEPLESRKYEIQKELNFENYLGEKLYLEFCSYKREQEYNNSNYISDGLSNAELMAKAKEFLDAATKELYKSANRQHRISTTLYNLLAMPEFKELVKKFALGNFIRVQVDKDIYRLRLINYTINFSDLTKISVEFSDLTKTANGLSDVQSILSSAQSMSKSYNTVSKQAEKGQTANRSIDEMIETGLNNALIKIKNNTNEEVTIDNNGIIGRSYDDITGTYSPKQYRLTSNLFLFTKNNWRSSELGIGEMTYSLDGKTYEDYGIITKYLISGKIIAGDIYSANYSSTNGTGTHINLENGSFTLADSKIVYNSNTNDLTLKGVTIAWDTTNSPEITDISGLKEYLNQLDGRIQTYSQDTDPSVNWTSEEKQSNIGDLWFDTKNNLTKRWNGSSWDTVTDSELEKLAKSKAQIFTTTPTIPYYVGDLWVQGSSGDIMNCVKTRTSGVYTASDWAKSSKYTDDTVAKEALESARKGIEDAAKGINLANEAKELADNAQIRAEEAETNSKEYADNQDTALSNSLTDAYQKYTNSEISKFNTQVANYFGLSGGTIFGENYIMSPLIAGGYLNITSTDNKRVIIDPNNLTGNNCIFQVHNGKEISVGIEADGDAIFNGKVYAKDGEFTGKVTASSGAITGDLEFGGSLYSEKDNYKVTLRGVQSDLTNGVFYIEDLNGDENGNRLFPYRVNGDGSFEATKATIKGFIEATEGRIANIIIEKDQGLYYSPTTSSGFGLWATSEHDNIAIHAGSNNTSINQAPFRVYYDGTVIANNLTSNNITLNGGYIGGIDINTSGIFYSASNSDSWGLWKGGAHKEGTRNIIFHAGKNNQNVGSAPLKIYSNGDVVANNLDINGGTIGNFQINEGLSLNWTINEAPTGGIPQDINYYFKISDANDSAITQGSNLLIQYGSSYHGNRFSVDRIGQIKAFSLTLGSTMLGSGDLQNLVNFSNTSTKITISEDSNWITIGNIQVTTGNNTWKSIQIGDTQLTEGNLKKLLALI